MPIVDTTSEELSDRENHALAMVSALAERVDPALPVGDGAWTAREVLAHLVTVIGRYLNPKVQLASTAREVDELNRAEMAGLADHSVSELVAELGARHKTYQEVWGAFPLDLEFPFHAGLKFDVASLRSNWMSELLVHGYDVAAAAGEDWPLEERDLLLSMRVVLAALPGYWKGGGDLGHIEVALAPAGSNPHTIVVDGAQLRVVEGLGSGADVVLGGSAAALALFFYGRIDQADAEARGLVVTGSQEALDAFMDNREVP